jgi:hypothetical protein
MTATAIETTTITGIESTTTTVSEIMTAIDTMIVIETTTAITADTSHRTQQNAMAKHSPKSLNGREKANGRAEELPAAGDIWVTYSAANRCQVVPTLKGKKLLGRCVNTGEMLSDTKRCQEVQNG